MDMIGKVFENRLLGIVAMVCIAGGAVVSIAGGFRVAYTLVTMIGAQ